MLLKNPLLNIFYFFFFICLGSSYLISKEPANPYLLVSIAPHKFFVEKIAGSTVDVGLIVPACASAHTYEPSPKQMMTATQASIWFKTGEPFEEKLVQSLTQHSKNLLIVDLRKGLTLLGPEHGGCRHHAHCMDLHYWLSAPLAKIQAQTIAEALIKVFPEQEQLYKTNLSIFLEELDKLDQSIIQILKPLKNRNILVSHPAYAYFAKEYHLNQYSIEFEGRDPTSKQLHAILNLARQLNIKTIYTQMQYSNKGAKLIAEQIGARIVNLDPYAENYIQSMLEIAQAFSKGDQ